MIQTRIYNVIYRHRVPAYVDATDLCFGALLSVLRVERTVVHPFYPFSFWRDGCGYVNLSLDPDDDQDDDLPLR